MKKLSAPAFRRAGDFLRADARPLDRALFAHEFEGAPLAPALAALAAFRNEDGGFGHGLEPDLRMPGSSVLATATALEHLRDLRRDSSDPMVRGGIAWLAGCFDPELGAWRNVGPEAESWPHAPHWGWEFHRDSSRWDHLLNPGSRVVALLSHWRDLAPQPLAGNFEKAFLAHVASLAPDAEVGVDSLYHSAEVENHDSRAKLCALAAKLVTRDPTAWTSYCVKPLRLAPLPDSPLAECLVSETAANLDWEIDQQGPDGAWQPNWTWQGGFPADWEVARREWQGDLTLRTLRSLRAYGRIEGL